MKRRILMCGLLVTALAVRAYGEDKHEHNHKLPPAATSAGLEKMKTLVGSWVAVGEDGKPTDKVVSVIKLTAGGSAVHETFFPGEPMEMVSVYTADGPGVLLTHYCVLGNQPRMKAEPKASDNQLKFEFVGGSNLDVKKDQHMHGAMLTIVDADHINIDGVAWDKGEVSKEMCQGMKLVRKK